MGKWRLVKNLQITGLLLLAGWLLGWAVVLKNLAGQPRQVAMGMTCLGTGLLLLFFLLLLWQVKRQLLTPLEGILQDVESLGTPGGAPELRKSEQGDLNRFTEQMNLMLARLQQQSTALFTAQLELQRTEIQRQRSLVISLKKQINAHFAVNVLSNIRLLAEQGQVAQAGEMSDGLSYLLRYANAGDEFIDGMEELRIVEKYLSIMAIRFPGKFTVNMEWDDRLDGVNIPRMLVQPLVENAIMHGFSHMNSGALLEIKAQLNGDLVEFTVADNGKGMEQAALEKLQKKLQEAQLPLWSVSGLSHVALANIQRRIHSYYGMGYGLQIKSRPDKGSQITLQFPANCPVE